jgi:hypothetical protein
MAPPSISRATAEETIKAVEEALRKGHKPSGMSLGGGEMGAVGAAARALGTDHSTVTHRLRKAQALYQLEPDWSLYEPLPRGALPGFEVRAVTTRTDKRGDFAGETITQGPERGKVFEVPEGHSVKGLSTLVGPDGRTVAQWVKTGAGPVDPAAYCKELEEHFAKFKPAAKPIKSPKLKYEDQLTLYPWADPHFGLMVWGSEASENWDLKISVKTIRETFAQVVARTPPTKQAILLVGGDTLHADNNLNRTPQSGHALQVDGRHQKVILTACETIVANADLLLGNHKNVEIIVIPGNHDETSAYPIAMFLSAWYRNSPRISVDLSPSLFRFREFGRVMLGATHGHAAKAKDMPAIMAARQPEAWGRTKHRFVHTFHVHHSSKLLSEGGGCISETHQIIAPQDAWHYGAGFLSGRSMQSICYDRERGEVARARVAVG